MSLTRGVKSHFPCPRCLIPADEQGVFPSARAAARTTTGTKSTVEEARQLGSGEKEELLKSVGLRDIDVSVVFSSVSCFYL